MTSSFALSLLLDTKKWWMGVKTLSLSVITSIGDNSEFTFTMDWSWNLLLKYHWTFSILQIHIAHITKVIFLNQFTTINILKLMNHEIESTVLCSVVYHCMSTQLTRAASEFFISDLFGWPVTPLQTVFFLVLIFITEGDNIRKTVDISFPALKLAAILNCAIKSEPVVCSLSADKMWTL